MHLKRTEVSKKIPIKRKGTSYVVRPLSHVNESVPVVIALRDMLGIAKTSREVKYLLHNKLVKINGREAKDIREPVKLFNVLEAGKKYTLTILPTGRFAFEEIKKDSRFCKVIGKKILREGKVQLNLHDGTNLMGDTKININDTVEIDFKNKILSKTEFAKGKNIFIMSGRSAGIRGKILELEENKVKVKLDNGKEVELEKSHVMVI